MKYCSMCGNQLNDNARFCIACGSKVQEEIANVKVPGKKGKVIKIKPRGKKSAREKIEIVIMLILLFVIGFNIYAFSTDATNSYSDMEISPEDDNYTTAEVSTELTTEVATETPKSEGGEAAEEAALREELFDEIINKFYNRLENKTVENFMLDYNVPYVDIDYSGDWLEIFSYTFEDVTDDGIDDLWIYSEEARCNVWFTVYNRNIYALSPNTYALINTSMDSMYYREDGTFIRVVAGASSSVGYITYTVYSLSGQGSSMEMVAEEEVEYRFNNISSSGTSVSIDNADEIYYYQWKRYSDGTSTKNDKTITKAEADNYLANYSTNLIEYPSSGYSFSDYDPWE